MGAPAPRDLMSLLRDFGQRITALERRIPSRPNLASTVSPWLTNQTVAVDSYASVNVPFDGLVVGDAVHVVLARVLPDGVYALGQVTADGVVRVTVHNRSAASYVIPIGTPLNMFAVRA